MIENAAAEYQKSVKLLGQVKDAIRQYNDNPDDRKPILTLQIYGPGRPSGLGPRFEVPYNRTVLHELQNYLENRVADDLEALRTASDAIMDMDSVAG